MVCNRCGCNLVDGINICPSCGNQFLSMNQNNMGYPNQQMNQGYPNQQMNQGYPNQQMNQGYPNQQMNQGYPNQPMNQGYMYQPTNQNYQNGMYQMPQQPMMQQTPNGYYQMPNEMASPQQNNITVKPKKKKKGFAFFLLLLILVAGGYYVYSTYFSKRELTIDKGTRTIMVYMIGSNLESQEGQASDDIEEMINAKFNPEDNNVVIYTAGSTRWNNKNIKSNKNTIFEITEKGLKKVREYEKKNAATAESITEFINYVYDNYDTDLYDIVFWDHGGGPVGQYGADENYKNAGIKIDELDKALNDTKLLKKTKFEIIGFDACLMGSIEIANVLKEEANYYIASEESIPGLGWDYSFLSKVNRNTTSKDIGKLVVDSFYNTYDSLNELMTETYGYKGKLNVTLSMLDLSKVENVVNTLDNSFSGLSDSVSVTAFNSITRGARRSTLFGYLPNKTSYDLVDLYDLSDDISTDIESNNDLKKAIEELVVYEKNNIKGSHGVSIYFPVENKSEIEKRVKYYEKLNFSKSYTNFLSNYNNIINGTKLITTTTKSLEPNIAEDGIVSLQVPEEIAENYESSDYTIFINLDYGTFPVYQGKNSELKDNTLSITPLKKELVICDKEGNDCRFILTREYEKTEDSVIYTASISLENVQSKPFKFDITPAIFYIEFKNDSTKGEVIGIKALNDPDECIGKSTINLKNYTHIAAMSNSYTLVDENGDTYEEWHKGVDSFGKEYSLEENNYSFVIRDLDATAKYSYVFRIKDTQNNLHVLPKVDIN